MALASVNVAPTPHRRLALEEAGFRIADAIALQEMAGRIKNDNVEDFDMLQRVSWLTVRLLEEAAGLMEEREEADDAAA